MVDFLAPKNIKAIALEKVEKLPISEAVPIVAKFTSDDSIRLVQQVSDTHSSRNGEKATIST